VVVQSQVASRNTDGRRCGSESRIRCSSRCVETEYWSRPNAGTQVDEPGTG
jgi:hypothetical protein